MCTRWSNWAGGQVCARQEMVRPTSEEQLAELVARVGERGRQVRWVGFGHSFTDCACAGGVMVDMTGMQRILDVDGDRARVTVEGGIKLHRLGPELAAHGLGLENQGDIDRQSMTGAISTATHGTGARLQNISARIIGLRLVTADGRVRELSADGDEEEYLAARVSVGALGVISSVTTRPPPVSRARGSRAGGAPGWTWPCQAS